MNRLLVRWARVAPDRSLAIAATVAALVVGISACEGTDNPSANNSPAERPAATAAPTPSATATPTRTAPATAVKRGTALALLATLTVKNGAPQTGYTRERYGPAWADTDRNGCDTRNDVLRHALIAKSLKTSSDGCTVLSGTITDPYTATSIHFVRGGASELDIDHVVALGDSWRTGAAAWPAQKRLAFANDSLNLLAVDASANRQKGDANTDSWLPPNKKYRCSYVARQVAVKARYQLWVIAAERDAMRQVLGTCPSVVAPTGVAPTLAPMSASAPKASSTKSNPPKHTSGSDPQFGTCREAIAHGYGPYYQGKDPEYAWYDDRDHDGAVCE
jgi:hypothetical protein